VPVPVAVPVVVPVARMLSHRLLRTVILEVPVPVTVTVPVTVARMLSHRLLRTVILEVPVVVVVLVPVTVTVTSILRSGPPLLFIGMGNRCAMSWTHWSHVGRRHRHSHCHRTCGQHHHENHHRHLASRMVQHPPELRNEIAVCV
jgi:hypothetical protein